MLGTLVHNFYVTVKPVEKTARLTGILNLDESSFGKKGIRLFVIPPETCRQFKLQPEETVFRAAGFEKKEVAFNGEQIATFHNNGIN